MLLSCFAPADEIFDKAFKYVRPQAVSLDPLINNEDGLFENLPELTEKQIRTTNRMRLPMEMTLQLKMEKLERRQ